MGRMKVVSSCFRRENSWRFRLRESNDCIDLIPDLHAAGFNEIERMPLSKLYPLVIAVESVHRIIIDHRSSSWSWYGRRATLCFVFRLRRRVWKEPRAPVQRTVATFSDVRCTGNNYEM